MAGELRYTVLGKGEVYTETSIVKRVGKEPSPLRSVDDARALLAPQVKALLSEAAALPKAARLDEVVFELRMDRQYMAKSYHPGAFLRATGLEVRGVGTWQQKDTPGRKPSRKSLPTGATDSRSLFVSGTDSSLNLINEAVTNGVSIGADGDLIKFDAIRLPVPSDRLRFRELAQDAVEIVLYAWDWRHRDEAVELTRQMLRDRGVEDRLVRVRAYPDGPTFIAAVAPPDSLDALAELNFLRATKPLPRVELTRTSMGAPLLAPPRPYRTTKPLPRLAIYDAGTDDTLPHLAGWVKASDLTPRAATTNGMEHGTAVAGAALYGSLRPDDVLEEPTFGVLAYRVLPDPDHDALELYGAVDAIEQSVKSLPPDVRFVNLSFGPAGPIDDSPSRFTYAIDRLRLTTGRLFFIAVGNWGARAGNDARIQAPSDSVSNIAVGAYRIDPHTALFHPAPYSCKGPGRPGGVRKPDIVAFGGCPTVPFNVLDLAQGRMVGVQGTSFACPVASSLAAELSARIKSPIDAEATRALILHTSRTHEGDIDRVGHGILPHDVEAVVGCSATRVTVLFSGTITARAHWKMPFLLPDDFDPGGSVDFTWTITYTPPIDYHGAEEYTLAGVEVQFRPHARRYRFRRKGERKTIVLDLSSQETQAAQLLAQGYTVSGEPVSDGGQALSEQERRTVEAKWETVVRGEKKNKRANTIFKPCLTIAILGRGAWDQAPPDLAVPFAAVLTVNAPSYQGDLYERVRAARDKLEPLGLRTRAQVRAQGRI